MAVIYSSHSLTALEGVFFGDPIGQANQAIIDKLQQAIEFTFGETPTDAVGNLVVTPTKVKYSLAPGSVAPAGAMIVINGAGFPRGASDLSVLSADHDYRIASVSVIVDDLPGTNFIRPVSAVTLGTRIVVEAERVKAFGLTGFSISAGNLKVQLTGRLTTSLAPDETGDVTISKAKFSEAILSITYDTDPSLKSTKLAQVYMKGSFSLDAENTADPLTSASITDFGFKAFPGTDLAAKPTHYLYGESLGITLEKVKSTPEDGSTADLLRSVFNSNTDTVYTLGSFDMPEGFEKVFINGTGNVQLDANGLDNTIVGNPGDNVINGYEGADVISGGIGNDYLQGGGGGDSVMGEMGSDSIDGGAGNDTLTGGAGNDVFYVSAGNDRITDLGAGGNDVLRVSSGASVIATVTNPWVATATSSNAGTADLSSAGFSVNLSGVAYGTRGFTITNTGAATVLTGSSLPDTLIGGVNNDTLSGGGGSDILTGAAGIDVITGGEGADDIASGQGADIVNLTETLSSRDVLYFNGGTGPVGSLTRATSLGVDTVSSLNLGSSNTAIDVLCFSPADFGISGTAIQGTAQAITGVVASNTDGNFYITTIAPAATAMDLNGATNEAQAAIVFVGNVTGTNGINVYFTTNEGAFSTNTSVLIAKLVGLNTAQLNSSDISFASSEKPSADLKFFDDAITNDARTRISRVGDVCVSEGGPEANILVGTTGEDSMLGGGGADRFYSSKGNDFIGGGDGIDSVTFRGNSTAYHIERLGAYWIVSDEQSNPGLNQGEDTLSSIERVGFADKVLALDTDGVAGQAYRIYKAAYNRAPDAAGLGFWIAQMDQGHDVVNVAERFIDSSEFRAIYGANPSNAEFLTKLYQNVLGRNPEASGFNWWLNELNSNPDRSKAIVLSQFAESAENQANVASLIGSGISYEQWLE
jgi:Ca2+-binding RTX toxin-like protein